MLERLGNDPGVSAVVIPRTEAQAQRLAARPLPSVTVPERAIDAQSLIAYADLVVGAGGTMNREAVALGTPVHTIFSGRMGAVDERADRRGPAAPARPTSRTCGSSSARTSRACAIRATPSSSSTESSGPWGSLGPPPGRRPSAAGDEPPCPTTIDALFAFLVAAGLAWLLVPLTERLATRIGAIDVPIDRSLHEVPTPKLGGLAILAGVLVAGLIWLPLEGNRGEITIAILAGATVIAAVGVVDDVFDLPPAVKLVGQIAAAIIPVSVGVTVDEFTFPFVGGLDPGSVKLFELPLVDKVDLGEVATVIGIVAMVNVINFIDGVDGLAAGVCVIAAASLAVIALSLDRTAAGILAALTAGAALGFLRHGFPPASSFMGDTGSNLLGYLLAIVAVQGALKTNAVVALFLPLLVLAVPILDSSFVIAKRLKYRQPIYVGDRSHFHHRMANIGFSQRRTLAYLYGWALIMAGLALALRFVPYSDDHGNFDFVWTAVMVLCGLIAIAASIYLVFVLEILKLRRFRLRQLRARGEAEEPAEAEADAGVAHELETGSFAAVNPEHRRGRHGRPGDRRVRGRRAAARLERPRAQPSQARCR